MWTWLKSFFVRDRLDIYSPKERLIYKFFNGERMVTIDPIVLNQRVMDAWPDMSIPMKIAMSSSKAAKQGRIDAVNKIREVFMLKPLTNGIEVVNTLTDVEAINLLTAFLTYCGNVKKNSPTLPTMSKPTEDFKPTSGNAPPTSSTSDSGSTENECLTEKPVPSNTESVSPSV